MSNENQNDVKENESFGSDYSNDKDIVYGRTHNGSTFKVPHTVDMLATVFDTKAKKSAFDILTFVVIGCQVVLFFVLPASTSKLLFLFLFLFWRTAYNAGLGILLKYQSDKRGLVLWVKRKRFFNKEKGGKIYLFLKKRIERKDGQRL